MSDFYKLMLDFVYADRQLTLLVVIGPFLKQTNKIHTQHLGSNILILHICSNYTHGMYLCNKIRYLVTALKIGKTTNTKFLVNSRRFS